MEFIKAHICATTLCTIVSTGLRVLPGKYDEEHMVLGCEMFNSVLAANVVRLRLPECRIIQAFDELKSLAQLAEVSLFALIVLILLFTTRSISLLSCNRFPI